MKYPAPFSHVIFINSHDQQTIDGMDKAQRLNMLLHFIQNKNVCMLILT